jgi:hypothetical protein
MAEVQLLKCPVLEYGGSLNAGNFICPMRGGFVQLRVLMPGFHLWQ